MKEQIHPKANLAKIMIDCPNGEGQPFWRCREHCLEQCQSFFDMEYSLEIAKAIAKGQRRREWWSARQRAQEVDRQIEDAYLSRSDTKAMMGDWR